jgi:hypothetical protein
MVVAKRGTPFRSAYLRRTSSALLLVSRIDHTRFLNPGDDGQGLVVIAWIVTRQTVPMSGVLFLVHSPQTLSTARRGDAFPGVKRPPYERTETE